MTVLDVAVAIVAFVVAGIAKGALGMGLPPVALGILSFALPLEASLAIMVIPTMLSNVWQAIYGGGFRPLMRRFGTMAAGSVVALLAVALAFGKLGTPTAAGWVGVVLVVYALLALTAWRPAVSRSAERWANPLIGVLSGAVAGVTGVAAVPFLPYMQSLEMDRHELVQALGIMFLFIIGALMVALALQGSFTPVNLAGGIGAIAPTFLGVWLGQKARRRIPAERFRLVFLVGMLLVGLQMSGALV